MGQLIYKLHEDEYLEYSTQTDTFYGHILNRAEAVAQWGAERIARCDHHWTSQADGGPHCWPKSPEEAVAGNHCGAHHPDVYDNGVWETEDGPLGEPRIDWTLEQIREFYRKTEGAWTNTDQTTAP